MQSMTASPQSGFNPISAPPVVIVHLHPVPSDTIEAPSPHAPGNLATLSRDASALDRIAHVSRAGTRAEKVDAALELVKWVEEGAFPDSSHAVTVTELAFSLYPAILKESHIVANRFLALLPVVAETVSPGFIYTFLETGAERAARAVEEGKYPLAADIGRALFCAAFNLGAEDSLMEQGIGQAARLKQNGASPATLNFLFSCFPQPAPAGTVGREILQKRKEQILWDATDFSTGPDAPSCWRAPLVSSRHPDPRSAPSICRSIS